MHRSHSTATSIKTLVRIHTQTTRADKYLKYRIDYTMLIKGRAKDFLREGD